MRVLQVHCLYQRPSGEETVLEQEASLLREHGHEVVQALDDNRRLVEGGRLGRASGGLASIYDFGSRRRFERVLEEVRPEVVHAHNLFAAWSPSVFTACLRAKIPSVWSLHNYRITCGTSVLYRDGLVCKECVGRMPWPVLWHGCSYEGSRATALAISAAQAAHRLLRTYEQIDAFIAMSGFQKSILMQAGLRPERIHVKPHFVTPVASASRPRERTFVYVGQLLRSKGVFALLAAWKQAALSDWSLELIGTGPDEEKIRKDFANLEGVGFLGRLPREEALERVAEARYLVLPTRMLETFGLVAVEAMAHGAVALVSDLGLLPDLVADTGMVFRPNDAKDLASTLRRAAGLSHEKWTELSRAAFERAHRMFSPEPNYERLMEIYERARAVSESR